MKLSINNVGVGSLMFIQSIRGLITPMLTLINNQWIERIKDGCLESLD